jgi:pSer/pThr/pTyr-binding forkhead associated (FHA) protein
MADGQWKKILQALPTSFSTATLTTAIAGGVGAFLGFATLGSIVSGMFGSSLGTAKSIGSVLLDQSLLTLTFGMGICSFILAADNIQSLRGKWDRDLWRGLPLFMLLSLAGGFVSTLFLNYIVTIRGLSWAITGIFIGVSIGLLRKDPIQAKRGAIGGVIGGFISGMIVDAFLAISYTDAAFAIASFLGVVLTGALIGLFMRLVQDTLQEAWLLGVTTGPYEGKRYPLNTGRVTVGRSDDCDISLYRQSELAMQSGALVAVGSGWKWEGEAIEINGQMQSGVMLNSGDTLKLGGTNFRYYTRTPQPQGAGGPQQAPSTFYSAPPAGQLPPQAAHFPVPAPASSTADFPVGQPSQPIPGAAIPPPIPQPPYVPPIGGSPTVSPSAGMPVVGTGQIGTPAYEAPATAQQLYLRGPHGAFPLPTPGQTFRLGRADDNNIQCPDPTISGYHATLENRGGQLVLTDLASTNGTVLNGQALAPQVPYPIQAGNRIHFGGCEYVVSV